MAALFKRTSSLTSPIAAGKDFSYLPENTYYFDSACQTLRPQQVIDAETAYYHTYNACGHRVKYRWGMQVDEKVDHARAELLKFMGKSPKEYVVAFTLNTTTGINLVMHQLPAADFDRIVTSTIEHNSVFLPSITWAREHGKQRLVLDREEDGSLVYKPEQLEKAVVILNTVSNIDGRMLKNAKELAKDTHEKGGIVLLDAAQHFAHGIESLKDVDFDAAFGSGHKLYAPSLGFIVIRRSLIERLHLVSLGGGTVNDVQRDTFEPITQHDEQYAVLELGLQNWAGIIGLGAALDWIRSYKPEGQEPRTHETGLSLQLFEHLRSLKGVHIINDAPRSVTSFYADGIDAHRLALLLGEQGIMCRSGYFCCHYYLQHLRKLPPLFRVSMGRNNTASHVTHFCDVLSKVLATI